MKKVTYLAIFILLILMLATAFHHHNDLLIHDDCPVCAVMKISVELPVTIPVVLFIVIFIIGLMKVQTVAFAASSSIRIRAPPFQ
jgi:hypothetical protein